MNKLINLYARNKGRGQPFRFHQADDQPDVGVLVVYDVIVSSDDDAEWLGGVSAETFVNSVRSFSGRELHVRLNSPGGDAFAGIAMAQALRETPAHVRVFVDGYAASSASMILAAADSSLIAPGAMVMIHKAWTIAIGNADDFMLQASVLEKLDEGIANLYVAKAGGKTGDWLSLMAAETWLSADEAIDIGLVDAKAEKAEKVKLAFDFSAYAKAPGILPTPSLPANDVSESQSDDDKELQRKRAKARAFLLTSA